MFLEELPFYSRILTGCVTAAGNLLCRNIREEKQQGEISSLPNSPESVGSELHDPHGSACFSKHELHRGGRRRDGARWHDALFTATGERKRKSWLTSNPDWLRRNKTPQRRKLQVFNYTSNLTMNYYNIYMQIKYGFLTICILFYYYYLTDIWLHRTTTNVLWDS